MNTQKTTLSQKMKKAEPTLELEGSDRRVLEIASQDWANYLKFGFGQGTKEQVAIEDPAEVEAFMTVWISTWLKKWRQRVKLLVGNRAVQDPAKAQPAANTETQKTSVQCELEMKDMIVSTLIKNAEICCTEILAQNIIKAELEKMPKECANNKEQELASLMKALSRAREMSQTLGPLIYVKVDKRYYEQVQSC